MWKRYQIELKVNRLTSGIPAADDLMRMWLESRRVAPEIVRDQTAMLERAEGGLEHSTIFYRNDNGVPCYEGRAFKAALKEAANVLKGVIDEKNFRARVSERVFVLDRCIPIPGEIKTGERPIAVMTRQGPRTSLKRFEYAEGIVLRVHLKVLDDGLVTYERLHLLLDYLSHSGIGADHSQGSGTFQLVQLKEVTAAR